jgi:hypothetical protein
MSGPKTQVYLAIFNADITGMIYNLSETFGIKGKKNSTELWCCFDAVLMTAIIQNH